MKEYEEYRKYDCINCFWLIYKAELRSRLLIARLPSATTPALMQNPAINEHVVTFAASLPAAIGD